MPSKVAAAGFSLSKKKRKKKTNRFFIFILLLANIRKLYMALTKKTTFKTHIRPSGIRSEYQVPNIPQQIPDWNGFRSSAQYERLVKKQGNNLKPMSHCLPFLSLLTNDDETKFLKNKKGKKGNTEVQIQTRKN